MQDDDAKEKKKERSGNLGEPIGSPLPLAFRTPNQNQRRRVPHRASATSQASQASLFRHGSAHIVYMRRKDTMAEGVAAPMGLTEGAAYSTQERVWIQGCAMARVRSALRGERRRADARRIQYPARLAARLVSVEDRAESDVEVQDIALTGRVKRCAGDSG
ncbi:hypothetical protein B0H10DRAFT_2230930 [Mycena sp. CBHHK59/15]|nr:hypothetical protein B0H10DRAFT_2230930 [Mycena sp. CBHHK59/15]